jgi:hypothetical protein
LGLSSWWFWGLGCGFLFFASRQGFPQAYSVSAYVDAGGGFSCIYNAETHEFYGRWVFCEVWEGRRGVSGGVWDSLGA